ncbi:MAG: hypothetical protein F4118_11265 [Acidimicrobiaceae bacterium]|nr:hypothetical protein [Acidimicrobiaceae bacterium]MYI36986.1 hypothetical protein [Acidimicrobiaceae bacterium]
MPRTIRSIILAVLAVCLLAAACGGGGGGGGGGGDAAAWCVHLDDIVEEGWDEYDAFPGNTAVSRWRDVTDIDPTDPDRVWVYDGDLTDEEQHELAAAFDDAVQAGRRYDGREAVRAWEESLRDAC